MNARPHIVWDWNGTLLDDVDAGIGALNRMLADRGLPAITRDFYRARFRFPVRPLYFEIGMDPDREWDRICVEFHDYLAREPQHIRPDALAALAYVRAKGARQSLLSACRQDLLLRDTAREGVQAYLDEIYGVDNLEGATKLSRGRELVAKIRDAGPDAVAAGLVFIGDTLHDAEVASALGGRVVLVDGGHQHADRLRAAGHAVAPSLLDAVKSVLG